MYSNAVFIDERTNKRNEGTTLKRGLAPVRMRNKDFMRRNCVENAIITKHSFHMGCIRIACVFRN